MRKKIRSFFSVKTFPKSLFSWPLYNSSNFLITKLCVYSRRISHFRLVAFCPHSFLVQDVRFKNLINDSSFIFLSPLVFLFLLPNSSFSLGNCFTFFCIFIFFVLLSLSFFFFFQILTVFFFPFFLFFVHFSLRYSFLFSFLNIFFLPFLQALPFLCSFLFFMSSFFHHPPHSCAGLFPF